MEEQKARHTSNANAPPEVNLAKILDGLKDNEHFSGSEELAAMQAKAEQAWEADKLARRQARTPEVAVQSAYSALQNRKATLAKLQAKITELEEAAKAAVEAVEEASRRRTSYKCKSTSYKQSAIRSGHVLSRPRILSHISGTPCVRHSRAFLEVLRPSLSSHSWKRLSQAFRACWRPQSPRRRPSMRATTSSCSRTRTGPFQPNRWPAPSSARWKVFPRTSTRPRSRSPRSTSSKSAGFSHLKRLAAGKLPQARDHRFHPLPRLTTANVTAWKSGQLMLDTIPHSDFWALQETHLTGSEHVAAAQRWARKRGWAASFQGAEVVGQHNADNRSGVAVARPLHISSSAPSEFKSMLDEAAILAPEGVEEPLPYLRSRILARHNHAMGWNMEPHDLSQAVWLDTVNGKVFAPSVATCAGGAGTVLDCFVASEAMAHLVQQVEVVDNSPTMPHRPVRLTLKATPCGHRVLARKRPKPFLAEVPVGPQRQEERVDWTWAAEETPGMAGVAARSRSSVVPYSRPSRSSAQAFPGEEQRVGHRARFPRPGYAQGHEEDLQQKGRGMALAASLGGSVGNLAAWRNGRTSLHTSQRPVHTVASISLPDLGSL